MQTQFRLRSLLTLAFAGLVLAGCAEETQLETNLNEAEVQDDVAAVQAAFDNPASNSFSEMGGYMDAALAAPGGAMLRAPMQALRQGSTLPLEESRNRLVAVFADGEPSAIPVSALGKTFVWNTTTGEYEVSARTGAPANGVRFVLYQVSLATFLPAVPLVEVGYADFVRAGSSATVSVFVTGGTKVLEYTATVGGTEQFPTFSVEGFAGTGANRAEFNLAIGVSATTGNVATTWRTDVPSRGLTSRVSLLASTSSVTFNAMMRRGLRKIEIGGTFTANGATLTVEIGDRVFARITITGETETITGPNGEALTAEQVATLEQIFDWFEGAFDAPLVLVGPLATLLDAGNVPF